MSIEKAIERVTKTNRAVAEFKCPTCKRKRGVMCVGTGPKLNCDGYERAWGMCHHPRAHKASDNHGQTLKVAHVARLRLVIDADAKATKQAQVKQLRDWLVSYGDIFREDTDEKVTPEA